MWEEFSAEPTSSGSRSLVSATELPRYLQCPYRSARVSGGGGGRGRQQARAMGESEGEEVPCQVPAT